MGQGWLCTRCGILATTLPSARSASKRASPFPRSSPCQATIPPSPAHSCSASANSHSVRVGSGWNVAFAKPELAHRSGGHSSAFSNDVKVASTSGKRVSTRKQIDCPIMLWSVFCSTTYIVLGWRTPDRGWCICRVRGLRASSPCRFVSVMRVRRQGSARTLSPGSRFGFDMSLCPVASRASARPSL
eukprot:6197790-Pleurochrysis_carterae.AAC.1